MICSLRVRFSGRTAQPGTCVERAEDVFDVVGNPPSVPGIRQIGRQNELAVRALRQHTGLLLRRRPAVYFGVAPLTASMLLPRFEKLQRSVCQSQIMSGRIRLV